MKRTFRNLIGAVTLAAGLMAPGIASAAPVFGGLSYAGGYTAASGNLTTPNLSLNITSAFVTNTSGLFTVLAPGSNVTVFTPLTINPISQVTPLGANLWSVGIFSFSNTTIWQETPVADEVTLRGTGMVNATGYDSRPGSWIATFNTKAGTFSYSASSGVPDGGTSIALLGASLLGLAGLRRKFRN